MVIGVVLGYSCFHLTDAYRLSLGSFGPQDWLTVANQWERRCAQRIRALRTLQVLNAAAEIEKSEAVKAKAKAKAKDELESAMTNFKVM
ncbi:hypothetical protein PIB30_043451 [Stylosanthes scabra]|uniref:Uncharacterized protein n=1 Tax=Stylosanthes scabra TaxID=79078 RepID=A0ABU6XEQ3_9FABA|nr:hypothetical protein [Stylosanthes scabra]